MSHAKDEPESMPDLQNYLIWMQHLVEELCRQVGVEVPEKPTNVTKDSAGWGNGNFPPIK